MNINIEIKARVKDLSRLRKRVEELSDAPCKEIHQEDTFFYTSRGRLKLRILAPDYGELIYYEREDVSGPKPSHYLISPSTDPDSLKTLLASTIGVRGIVKKRRLLYKTGNVRIHIDEVDGLGLFVEIEVVLGPGQTLEEERAVATELIQKLGIEASDLLEEAYIDLLEKHAT